ncbi:hypothetical protein QN277_021112 [Acacia crassicarpa]|uniref:Retrotransposon gag domain-containing protein n=1 Tax=Acacia crassicarpa TaxID=499986 RepID=A0AAE1MT63_9FABA|nr:hypothetical protein QN277_021112 [Acacia crassicarpa]
MWVRSIDGPVILRLFSATLTGPAHKWLNSLPSNSIRSFEDLRCKFELHFATSKKQSKSEFTLSKVKQKKGETLQRYLNRFRDVAMQVRSLSEGVRVHRLVNGLDPSSRLARNLCKNTVYTLTEFYTRAKQYLDVEQMEITNADESERLRNSTPDVRDWVDRQRAEPRRRNGDSRHQQ